MDPIWALQNGIQLILWVVLLALKGYALGDAIFRPAEAFPAAGKQTKQLWLLLTGLAVLAHVFFSQILDLFNIAGTIVAAVYVVGVLPALRGVGGGKRGAEGPYGPW